MSRLGGCILTSFKEGEAISPEAEGAETNWFSRRGLNWKGPQI